MIKAAEQKRIVLDLITIEEYIRWKQPDIINTLVFNSEPQNIVLNLDTNDPDSMAFEWWRRLMEEPPKLGRAGGG